MVLNRRLYLTLCLILSICVILPVAAHAVVKSQDTANYVFPRADDKVSLITNPAVSADAQLCTPVVLADPRLGDGVSLSVTKNSDLDSVYLHITISPENVSVNHPLRLGDTELVITGFVYNPEFLNNPSSLPLSAADVRRAGIPQITVVETLYPGYPLECTLSFPDPTRETYTSSEDPDKFRMNTQALRFTLQDNATVQTGVFVSVREAYSGTYRSSFF